MLGRFIRELRRGTVVEASTHGIGLGAGVEFARAASVKAARVVTEAAPYENAWGSWDGHVPRKWRGRYPR